MRAGGGWKRWIEMAETIGESILPNKAEEELLDAAWNERCKLMDEVVELSARARVIKKTAINKRKKASAISNKMKAMAPWKAKGLYNKQKNVIREVESHLQESTRLQKESHEIFERAFKLWDSAVHSIYGDVAQDWTKVKAKNKGWVCTLPNTLKFEWAGGHNE